MLRDKNLIPLSHQHQRALALCVRIDRAQPIAQESLHAWQTEIEQHFEREIKIHFTAEESTIFPAARRFSGLMPLIEDLLADHSSLRESFSQAEAKCMTAGTLLAFAQKFSTHIRKEERQLFERLQELMTSEELAALGTQLEAELADAAHACALPTSATQLRAKR